MKLPRKYCIGLGILLASWNLSASPILFRAEVSNISFFDYVTQATTLVPGTRTLHFSFDPATLGSTFTSALENLTVDHGSRIDSLFSDQIPFSVLPIDSFWYTVVANYTGPNVLDKSVTVKNRGTSFGSNGEIYGYHAYITSTEHQIGGDTSRYFMTDPSEIISYFTRSNPNLYFQENYYMASPNGSGGYSYPIDGVWQSTNITISVQTVPEPSTALMLSIGIIALARTYNRTKYAARLTAA